MPLASKRVSKDIVEFWGALTDDDIITLLRDEAMSLLQCRSTVPLETWLLLNEKFFSQRQDVRLRVYGFYSDICDLSFASLMTNVQQFSADSLHGEVKGINHIAEMPHLHTLRLGILSLDNFDVLYEVTDNIQNITLGLTKSRKPSLSPLSRFKRLKTIYLERQQKGIEVLAELTELEDVTLHSITTNDLDFLTPLKNLWSLDIKLGGARNLSALSNTKNLKYLELRQIQGLQDITIISTLHGLQYFSLQSLPQVNEIPPLEKLHGLKRILLINMKGLTNMKSLKYAPALEEFLQVEANTMQPAYYIPLLENPNLKRAAIGFGSKKKNDQFKQLLQQYNIEFFERPHKFQFV